MLSYQLSTLFPVLFAAIVGRLMMQAARWKLEEGSTLGSLEQLLGSRTVGGAILTPFHLRSLNFLGVGLLLLWAFSPLGAQATLRMVELRVAPRTEPSSALYFDTRSTSRFQDLTAVSPSTALLVEVVMDQIATIYNGLLLAPMAIKNDTMDLWGNVKVPLFSSLERRTETEGWTDVPNGDIQYSGLVGIPVVNITTGNTTFELESNYLELVCERVKKYEDKTDMPKLNETALLRWPITTEMPIRNGTFQGWPVDREVGDVSRAPWSIGVDRLVDKDWARGEFINAADDPTGELRRSKTNSLSLFQDEEDIEAGPTRLLFASTVAAQITGYREHVAAYCNISQHYVESNITCQKPNPSDRETCHVTAQRPSQRPHPSEHINSLNFPILLNTVSRYLPLATGNNVGDMSNADLTLADPALANISTPSRQPLQLADLDAETFSRRLTQVLNSYIHLGQMYTNALGNIGRDGSLLYQNTTVPTRVTNIVHVYQVPKIWAALSIVSCVVMLAGGTASVVFAHLAVGPEVLGFASTAVRDNKYMALPSETANMEGTDISVRLRDRRVRFGVTQEEDIDGMGVGFQEKVVRIKDAVKMSQG